MSVAGGRTADMRIPHSDLPAQDPQHWSPAPGQPPPPRLPWERDWRGRPLPDAVAVRRCPVPAWAPPFDTPAAPARATLDPPVPGPVIPGSAGSQPQAIQAAPAPAGPTPDSQDLPDQTATGPGTARRAVAEPPAKGPNAAKPNAAGPEAAGRGAAEPGAPGRDAAGRGTAEAGAPGRDAAGRDAAGPGAVRPRAAGPESAGQGAARRAGAGVAPGRPQTAGRGSGQPPREGEWAAGWPSQFAQVLAETLAGSRPAQQVRPWTTEQARKRIRQLGPVLQASQRPRVRRVLTSQPRPGVVEMAVIVGIGPRTRALAVRLEHGGPGGVAPDRAGRARPGRSPESWICTAIEAA